jgi:hypothetical protein
MANFLDLLRNRFRHAPPSPAELDETRLTSSNDEVTPLLAKRLTQVEASMAKLARAHSETLREREILAREVAALRKLDPEAPGAQSESVPAIPALPELTV